LDVLKELSIEENITAN